MKHLASKLMRHIIGKIFNEKPKISQILPFGNLIAEMAGNKRLKIKNYSHHRVNFYVL